MELLLVVICAGLAAQESDSDRLRRLEEQAKKQQAEIDELKKKPLAPAGDFELLFTDGLHIKSRGGDFDLNLGGRFIEHYRLVLGRPDVSRTVPDTFFVRESFIELEGTVYKEFGFRMYGDFTSSAGGPVASIETAWVEWKRFEEFRIIFGQFKAPNSMETMSSTLFPDCVERSILSRFVPGLELGINAYGKLWDGLLTYQAALTNGRSHLASAGRTRNDDNDEKEVLGRLTLSPFVGDKDSFLSKLRLGVYGSRGGADDVAMDPNFDVATTELSVTYLDSTAGFLDGRRTRMGAELSWAVGPASLRGELLFREDEIRDAASTVEEDLPTRAWYAQATWILTGEEKFVESRITPARPFNPGEGGWGAFEVVFRIAGAETGEDEFVAVGNTLVGQSNEVRTFTTGFNWYPIKHVRFSANYIHEDYREDVDFGGGRVEDALDGFLLRFQIDL